MVRWGGEGIPIGQNPIPPQVQPSVGSCQTWGGGAGGVRRVGLTKVQGQGGEGREGASPLPWPASLTHAPRDTQRSPTPCQEEERGRGITEMSTRGATAVNINNPHSRACKGGSKRLGVT